MKSLLFLSVVALAEIAHCLPSDPALVRRVEWRPYVLYRDDDEGKAKAEIVQGGIDDAFEMAAQGQVAANEYSDIIEKYFPSDWAPKVIRIMKQIIPDYGGHPKDGGPVVYSHRFVDFDWNHGDTNGKDYCDLGAEAYTENFEQPLDGEAPLDYSMTYICPDTFKTVFKGDQAQRRVDLTCDDFKFSNGRYRMTNEMEYVGATLFHEFMHNNIIAVIAFLDTPIEGRGRLDNMIIDYAYGPKGTRDLMKGTDAQKESTKRNADSYTWCALELVWTMWCKKELGGQNFRFDDAIRN